MMGKGAWASTGILGDNKKEAERMAILRQRSGLLGIIALHL
jgi:hypothetical protein